MTAQQRNNMLVWGSALFSVWMAGPLSILLFAIFYANYRFVRAFHKTADMETKTSFTMGIVFVNLIPMIFAKNYLYMLDGLIPFTGTYLFFPIGISYLSFRGLSYYFDVAYKKIEPVRNPEDLFLYMFFLPTYICGPVERARNFIPQLETRLVFSLKTAHKAILLITSGFIMKFFIADLIATLLVDHIYAAPQNYSAPQIWGAVYGYSAKIYFDFAGYTNMALGIALLLGFSVMENFNQPYRAVSIADFWRRWHISLSSWLMESIFTPLQLVFRRKKTLGTIAAILITFFLCAVWHDSGAAMILWGMIHGFCMIPSLLKQPEKQGEKQKSLLKIFITFHIVTFAWIFFRAYSLQTGFDIVSGLVNTANGFALPSAYAILLLLFAFILIYLPAGISSRLENFYSGLDIKIKLGILFTLVCIYILTPGLSFIPFVYTYF